ncbi:MAG: HAMP domain-containing sensor histidine kinase [Oscillospiraceae bacterium]
MMRKIGKILDRMNRMIENAMSGVSPESVFDETKMSAMESRLNQYLLMSSEKNRQLSLERDKIKALISDIAHQTKTPIANILLYSSLLNERNDLPEDAANMVSQIVEQSEKLDFLIGVLLKSSRLETGIISVTPLQNSVQELLANVMAQISHKAAEKEVSLSCKVGDEFALFDAKWTSEAVYNILDNAVKYTPPGGSVFVSVCAYEMFCRIDVRDTGIGIAEAEQSKIFGRFYRSPAVADCEGLGIGLYLSREILSAEGGYIKLISAPEKGATFSIFLPI